jgi:hypothetical protein
MICAGGNILSLASSGGKAAYPPYGGIQSHPLQGVDSLLQVHQECTTESAGLSVSFTAQRARGGFCPA